MSAEGMICAKELSQALPCLAEGATLLTHSRGHMGRYALG